MCFQSAPILEFDQINGCYHMWECLQVLLFFKNLYQLLISLPISMRLNEHFGLFWGSSIPLDVSFGQRIQRNMANFSKNNTKLLSQSFALTRNKFVSLIHDF